MRLNGRGAHHGSFLLLKRTSRDDKALKDSKRRGKLEKYRILKTEGSRQRSVCENTSESMTG
jgi:hypothetical protein